MLLRRRGSSDHTEPTRPVEAPVTEPKPPAGLRSRLSKTRRALGDRLAGVFSRGQLDGRFWSDLEESLVACDMGMLAATMIVERVRDESPQTVEQTRSALCSELEALLEGKDRTLHMTRTPSVVLFVGVNGTGKTTSIAKLGARLQREGRTVLFGAADTFRAAAHQQLRAWGDRLGVDVVGGQSGADPASVAFDSFHSAAVKGRDVVIVDTAGRLQTKVNLMEELAKIARILRREAGDIDEVLLVIDGTTGQNALAQARSFTDAVGVTGVILTKLDSTARGGVVVAVEQELEIPVKFIGVGEDLEDLIPFEPAAFVDALLGSGEVPSTSSGDGR